MQTTTKTKKGGTSHRAPRDETKQGGSLPAVPGAAKPPPTPNELDALRDDLAKAQAAAAKLNGWDHDKLARAAAKVAEARCRLDVAELSAMPLPASTVAGLRFVERDVPAAAIRLTGNHRELHDDLATARLARSIQVLTLQQRLGLRDVGDGTFELIWGHRRLAACGLVGLTEVPAKIYPSTLTAADVEILRTIENFGRKELTHVERAIAVARTLDAIGRTLAPVTRDRPEGVRPATPEDAAALREWGRAINLDKVAETDPGLAAAARLSRAIDDAGGLHEYVGLQLGYPAKWVRDNAYVSQLGGEARRLLAAHRIDVGHARELAKLGDPAAADAVARFVARSEAGLGGSGVETCRNMVAERLRSLRSVPWRLDVAFGAGKPGCTGQACATCRFNSNSDPDLFGGALADAPAAGVCTNEACFRAKTEITAKEIERASAKAVKRSEKDDGFAATERTMAELVPLHVKPASAARAAKKEIEARAPAAEGVSSDTVRDAKRTPEQRLDDALRGYRDQLRPLLEKATLADPVRWVTLAVLSFHPACHPFEKDLDADLLDAAGRCDWDTLARQATKATAKQKDSWQRRFPVLGNASGEFLAALAGQWGVETPPRPTLADFDRTASPAASADQLPDPPLTFDDFGDEDDGDEDPEPTPSPKARRGGARPSLAAAAKKAKVAESREAAAPAAVREYIHSVPVPGRALAWVTWNWMTTADAPDPAVTAVDSDVRADVLWRRLAQLADQTGTVVREDRRPADDAEVTRRCRTCGCTDDDCRQCIEKTGRPCSWVEADLCSACEPEAAVATTGAWDFIRTFPSPLPAEMSLVLDNHLADAWDADTAARVHDEMFDDAVSALRQQADVQRTVDAGRGPDGKRLTAAELRAAEQDLAGLRVGLADLTGGYHDQFGAAAAAAFTTEAYRRAILTPPVPAAAEPGPPEPPPGEPIGVLGLTRSAVEEAFVGGKLAGGNRSKAIGVTPVELGGRTWVTSGSVSGPDGWSATLLPLYPVAEFEAKYLQHPTRFRPDADPATAEGRDEWLTGVVVRVGRGQFAVGPRAEARRVVDGEQPAAAGQDEPRPGDVDDRSPSPMRPEPATADYGPFAKATDRSRYAGMKMRQVLQAADLRPMDVDSYAALLDSGSIGTLGQLEELVDAVAGRSWQERLRVRIRGTPRETAERVESCVARFFAESLHLGGRLDDKLRALRAAGDDTVELNDESEASGDQPVETAALPAGSRRRERRHRFDADVADVLRRSTAAGSTLTLPGGRFDHKLYERVDKAIKLMGGKWNRKQRMHLFPEANAGQLLAAALDDGSVLDRKQTFQFFETPLDVVWRLVELARIQPGMTVLEPSAGRGAIAREIKEHVSCALACVELDPAHTADLKPLCDLLHTGTDFLQFELGPGAAGYDRIVMNPPFSGGQDAEHVAHAFDLLGPGGRLVAIVGDGAMTHASSKCQRLRDLFDVFGVTEEQLPAGTFAESGTNAKTRIIVLQRAAAGSEVAA